MLSRRAGRDTAAIAGLIAATLATLPATRARDVLDGLGGTWGLAPVDGKPGLTGSYLSLYRNEAGGVRASLDLNPGGWSCRADVDVTWNQDVGRFEWPNRSSRSVGEACWLQASPAQDRLDVRISCPYECTAAATPHAISLERIAPDRLVPPEHVVDTFCSSHDALRQAVCRPGDLQQLIAEGNLQARRRGVLAEGNDDVPLLPDTEAELLSVLDRCHAAGDGRACLGRALLERRDATAAAVAARQQALAEERRRSQAAAVELDDDEAKAWEGSFHLVNDQMVATLALESCEASGCTLGIDGQTNYGFGYEGRRGHCFLTHAELSFIGGDRAFAYLEPGESDRDADGAGSFANFCRIDLERTRDGFRVGLRGVGCSSGCTEAQFLGLAGEYHPRPQPSFTCPAETFDLPWDEENLCLDPELAALDREMAAAFARAKAASQGAGQAALVRAQRDWIARRRNECDADRRRTCLVETYRKRLQELQPTPATRPSQRR